MDAIESHRFRTCAAGYAAVVWFAIAAVGCDKEPPTTSTSPSKVAATKATTPATSPSSAPRRSTGPLAFTSTRDGSPYIYLADADGTNATQLAAGEHAAWSADGTRIAFQTGLSSSPELHVIGVDGSGLRHLGKGSEPSWSPDGTKLAFALPSSGFDGIYVMNADGSNRTRLAARGFRLADDGLLQPVWSPDGQSIAFAVSNYDYPRQIYVVKLDGSEPRVLVGGDSIFDQSDPAWSPDGSSLVFTSIRTIHTVRADGTGWAPMVNGDGYDPDFSAGGQIVFGRFLFGLGPDYPMRIFIGVGGTARQLVPDAPEVKRVYWDHQPAWARR